MYIIAQFHRVCAGIWLHFDDLISAAYKWSNDIYSILRMKGCVAGFPIFGKNPEFLKFNECLILQVIQIYVLKCLIWMSYRIFCGTNIGDPVVLVLGLWCRCRGLLIFSLCRCHGVLSFSCRCRWFMDDVGTDLIVYAKWSILKSFILSLVLLMSCAAESESRFAFIIKSQLHLNIIILA